MQVVVVNDSQCSHVQVHHSDHVILDFFHLLEGGGVD